MIFDKAGRAVKALSADGPEDDSLRQTALQLGKIVAAGDELALAEFCAGLERDKWDRDSLGAMLDEAVHLLRDALVSAAGAPAEADPRRREAAGAAARALSPRALSRAAETLDGLRRDAAASNLGAGHLAGWLAAALST